MHQERCCVRKRLNLIFKTGERNIVQHRAPIYSFNGLRVPKLNAYLFLDGLHRRRRIVQTLSQSKAIPRRAGQNDDCLSYYRSRPSSRERNRVQRSQARKRVVWQRRIPAARRLWFSNQSGEEQARQVFLRNSWISRPRNAKRSGTRSNCRHLDDWHFAIRNAGWYSSFLPQKQTSNVLLNLRVDCHLPWSNKA